MNSSIELVFMFVLINIYIHDSYLVVWINLYH